MKFFSNSEKAIIELVIKYLEKNLSNLDYHFTILFNRFGSQLLNISSEIECNNNIWIIIYEFTHRIYGKLKKFKVVVELNRDKNKVKLI